MSHASEINVILSVHYRMTFVRKKVLLYDIYGRVLMVRAAGKDLILFLVLICFFS